MEILNLNTKEINQNGYHKTILTRDKIGALFIFPNGHVPEDCLACDGYALKIDDYQKLYAIIGKDYNNGSELEDEFRVPDYNLTGLFLQPGSKNFGTKKSAGLPKINLALRVDASGKVNSYYGNKSLSAYGTADYGGTMTALTDGNDEPMRLMSDATNITHRAGDLIMDTNIYGKSTTVQPPSQIVHICIKYK